MFKLKLKKALSYSGAVSANEKDSVVDVKTKKQADDAVATGYFEIIEEPAEELGEELGGEENGQEVVEHTSASLKKLNADEQRAILDELAFELNNNEEAVNEDERIALILKLQEEKKAGEE